MRHLFIARHGEYDDDDRLNPLGLQQMKAIGNDMGMILGDKTAHIVSSTAPRAIDSANALALELGMPHTEIEKTLYLWSGNDSPKKGGYDYDLNNLMKFVENRYSKRGLVIVTHYEIVNEFPSHFLKKEFGINEQIRELSKGEAVYFDLEKKCTVY